MNNQTNNKNLNDFLKKRDSDSLDDFEKEALQGFDILTSTEEVLELKSQLDKRIYDEVFLEKKSGAKIYWYAAAGLFLAIGLSIFLLLDSDHILKNKDLAIVREELKTEPQKFEDTSNQKNSLPPSAPVAEENKQTTKKADLAFKTNAAQRKSKQDVIIDEAEKIPEEVIASSITKSEKDLAMDAPTEANDDKSTMAGSGNSEKEIVEKAQNTRASERSQVIEKSEINKEEKNHKKSAKQKSKAVGNNGVEYNTAPMEQQSVANMDMAESGNEKPATVSISPEVLTIVEESAEFPGGAEALKKYLSDNIRYPENARAANITGKCFLKFIINEKGSISNIEVLKGIKECPECEKEAIRVVKEMPAWKPAKNNGHVVKCYFNLPVHFKLN